MDKIRVLHISVHLGGGIGKVLSSVAAYARLSDEPYQHEIILLEEPERGQFVDFARSRGVEIHILPSRLDIESLMTRSDIVQVEWWHHPLMAQFLAHFPPIPVRLLIWSHISGCFLPVIREDFIKMSSRFLFTSPYSLENPGFTKENSEFIMQNTDVVFSSGGFDEVRSNAARSYAAHSNEIFCIGYVGTLNPCKLHPEFVDYCASVNIPGSRFVVVGDGANSEYLKGSAKEKGILEQFELVGYVPEVNKELARFDVFGYPLNPEHYGTTENALLEAMASGIPPVVLDQCTEKYIVNHMQTGLLVRSKDEYGAAIRYLYQRPDERLRIGMNAREYVIKEFSIERTIANLNRNYGIAMEQHRKLFSFSGIFGGTPLEWFLSCLGPEKHIFEKSLTLQDTQEGELEEIEAQIVNCKEILREKSKSSIYHFHRYFPEELWLTYWAGLLDKDKRNLFHSPEITPGAGR